MTEPKKKKVYFISGASGVGKTSLVETLQKKYENTDWAFLHFDSIGVPSVEKMKKEFGSAVRWQEAKTYEWVDKIINEYENEKVFLEGQVNLQFIYGAFRKHHFEAFTIVLLHCNEKEWRKDLLKKESSRNW